MTVIVYEHSVLMIASGLANVRLWDSTNTFFSLFGATFCTCHEEISLRHTYLLRTPSPTDLISRKTGDIDPYLQRRYKTIKTTVIILYYKTIR